MKRSILSLRDRQHQRLSTAGEVDGNVAVVTEVWSLVVVYMCFHRRVPAEKCLRRGLQGFRQFFELAVGNLSLSGLPAVIVRLRHTYYFSDLRLGLVGGHTEFLELVHD